MNRKGFTLIELLIVVVIIGILAAIAIPKFASTKQKAYLASMKSDLRNLTTAQEAYFSDSLRYIITGTATNLPPAAPVGFPAGCTPGSNCLFVPSAGVTASSFGRFGSLPFQHENWLGARQTRPAWYWWKTCLRRRTGYPTRCCHLQSQKSRYPSRLVEMCWVFWMFSKTRLERSNKKTQNCCSQLPIRLRWLCRTRASMPRCSARQAVKR